MILPQSYVDERILAALQEDIHYVDVTTDYLIPPDQQDTAVFYAKAPGVLCGIDIALRVFRLLDGQVTVRQYRQDGDRLQPGDKIAELRGKTSCILKGERTALNLLQHLSGIATATACAVSLVEGTGAQITDTRKTLPSLRAMQKYAVTVGGGKNHRFNLSDGAMLKDNHIDAAGGIGPAVAALRAKLGHMVKIEVETRNLQEVEQALDSGAEVIMLDNMDIEMMKQAVSLAKGRAILEASGGITDAMLRQVAETGVDVISIGALTHSVQAMDISLKIVK